MLIKNIFNYYFSIIISVFLFITLTIYQINLEDLWFDELLTFWLTNPEVSNSLTYQNIIEQENTPPLYYFILKYFFNIFGYNYELLRIPNLVFNIFSIFVFFLF